MAAGKICYIEIPATDVEKSADFYARIFAWNIRVRGDGERAFDDSSGTVSGTWVLGRPANREPGTVVYIMVDDVAGTLEQIISTGGQVVTPRTALGPGGQAYATFRDPAGNVMGLYQNE